MQQETQQKLVAIHRRLVEKHPNWPAGKAKWIAMRMLELI